MRVLLFGATDLSLAVAERVSGLQGVTLAGVLHVGEQVRISYAPEGVRNVRSAPLAEWCDQAGVPHAAYEGPQSALELIDAVGAEFGLAAGWYHMVGRQVRDRLPRGASGLHASLLPRLRGGAPLNWALLAGEAETGVTLFELADGVDDGPVYDQRSFPVAPRATITELVALAEDASLRLVEECLPAIADGSLRPRPQSGQPTYCLQRNRDDGRIEWRRAAEEIDRLVRAVTRPYPGAWTTLDGRELIVWSAASVDADILGRPGQVARVPETPNPCVVCGDGVLELREVADLDGANALDDVRAAANRTLI